METNQHELTSGFILAEIAEKSKKGNFRITWSTEL